VVALLHDGCEEFGYFTGLVVKRWGKPVSIVAMRYAKYYKTRPSWSVKRNALGRPIERYSNFFVDIVYEQEGKHFLFVDGVMLRHFYNENGKAGPLNVLFTATQQPEEISADVVKKIKQ
jgi:hypothetical protein